MDWFLKPHSNLLIKTFKTVRFSSMTMDTPFVPIILKYRMNRYITMLKGSKVFQSGFCAEEPIDENSSRRPYSLESHSSLKKIEFKIENITTLT